MSGQAPGPLVVDGSITRGSFVVEVAARVQPGEVLVLLGPNGAGKSSVLRAIAGLEPLRRGRIELAGQLMDDGAGVFVPPEQRRVGLVFQDYRLFGHLHVLDNVAFAARSAGAGRRESRDRAAQWLERLDLTDLAGRRPAQLSGGQAQRVALARALAMAPTALLLDEPLAALDARTRLEVRAALRQHLVAFGGPVIVVTHDPVEAMVMGDRLMVLEGGVVVQEGSAVQVARRPATEYVARLVGLNLLAGAVSSSGVVELDDGGTLRGTTAGVVGQRVLVAVPPASISLHSQRPGPGSARNVWEGVVDGLEPLHDRVRVHVRALPPVLVDVTAAAVAELRLEVGLRVWLSVKATETEIYPGATSPPPRSHR